MPKRSDFVDHVLETMRDLGAIEVKRMFGGWGLYQRGTFFALVFDDVLYLKADDETRERFVSRGLEPFTFVKEGETIVTSYYQVPEEALESAEEMAAWGRLAYGAALRKAAKKTKKSGSE